MTIHHEHLHTIALSRGTTDLVVAMILVLLFAAFVRRSRKP